MELPGNNHLKSRTSTAVSGFTGDIRSELGGNPSFGPARSMGYSYDVAGNLTAKGSSYTDNGSITYTRKSGENVAYWDYRYDAQNQLATVFRYGETDPVKAVARYGYNYAGQRQKVVEGNRVTHYIYNLSGQVIQEVGYTVAGGDPFTAALPAAGEVTSYVYADGRQIAKVEGRPLQSGARYYMHHDNLGSTVLVTQASGNGAAVVYKQDYLPFGQSINVTGAENAEPDFKFTGQYEDRDTGLYYYGARYYDPEIGRFTQEDTYIGNLAVPQTLNLYVYTVNNPLRFVDPTGHSIEEFINTIYSKIIAVDERSIQKANERVEKMYEYANKVEGDKVVAGAQAALFMAGYDLGTGGIDGKAGIHTTEALKEFQKAVDLNPTGKIDEDTWYALICVTQAGMDKHQIRELGKNLGHYDASGNWEKLALNQRGKPYVRGSSPSGDDPASFDCSSYVVWVYRMAFGVQLPRTVEQIYEKTQEVQKPKPGDLVVFNNTADSNRDGKINSKDKSHIGIWLGDGKFIHASSSKREIRIELLKNMARYFDSFRIYQGLNY